MDKLARRAILEPGDRAGASETPAGRRPPAAIAALADSRARRACRAGRNSGGSIKPIGSSSSGQSRRLRRSRRGRRGTRRVDDVGERARRGRKQRRDRARRAAGSAVSPGSRADVIARQYTREIALCASRAGRGIRPLVTIPSAPPRLFDRALIARRLDRALKRPRRRRRFPPAPRRRGARGPAEPRPPRIRRGRRHRHARRRTRRERLAARPGARLTLRLAPTLLKRRARRRPAAVGDLERLPLGPGKASISSVSLYALHAVNDLPGALIQMRSALKPDGLMIAALAGGDTLVRAARRAHRRRERSLAAARRRACAVRRRSRTWRVSCNAPGSRCRSSTATASSSRYRRHVRTH